MKVKGKEKEKLEELGFGIPDGKELELNSYEVEYCLQKDYLKGRDKIKFKGDKTIYKVFKELREHGIILRFSKGSDLIRVYQKGFRPGEDRTKYLMKVVEGKFPSKEEIGEYVKLSKKMRKEFILAIVEDEISYLKINPTNLF